MPSLGPTRACTSPLLSGLPTYLSETSYMTLACGVVGHVHRGRRAPDQSTGRPRCLSASCCAGKKGEPEQQVRGRAQLHLSSCISRCPIRRRQMRRRRRPIREHAPRRFSASATRINGVRAEYILGATLYGGGRRRVEVGHPPPRRGGATSKATRMRRR